MVTLRVGGALASHLEVVVIHYILQSVWLLVGLIYWGTSRWELVCIRSTNCAWNNIIREAKHVFELSIFNSSYLRSWCLADSRTLNHELVIQLCIEISLIFVWFSACNRWFFHCPWLVGDLILRGHSGFVLFGEDEAWLRRPRSFLFLDILVTVCGLSSSSRRSVFEGLLYFFCALRERKFPHELHSVTTARLRWLFVVCHHLFYTLLEAFRKAPTRWPLSWPLCIDCLRRLTSLLLDRT